MIRFGIVLTVAAFAAGCAGPPEDLMTPQRQANGLVIVLPGIEGVGLGSDGVRDGLLQAGVNSAVAVYAWGRPIPVAGPLLNQVDIIGNRLAGERIAQMIVNYQDTHPNLPVYIVGHSGGGGVAVFTAEALPPGHKIDGLVLLSASLSGGYDLSKALANSRQGLVNFYSHSDVAFLMIGTMVAGNVDGEHGPSAGAIGFGNTFPGLFQVAWSEDMAQTGNEGGHLDSTASTFVSQYVAPWVLTKGWPLGQGPLAQAGSSPAK
jgi:pimeloyl-ACP methyl ester carboxylesterase